VHDRPTIVVCGALAHRPARGGHAWVFLNWLLGLRRLGYEPLFLDRVEHHMIGSGSGGPDDVEAALAWLHHVLDPHGLGDDVAVLGDGGEILQGPPRPELLARVAGAAALIDVMGFCDDDEVLAAAPLLVGLDIDPGFGQFWAADGLADPFAHHDRLLSVGLNLGSEGCTIPDLGRTWIPTPPPVVLEMWPDLGPGPAVATSVGAWRGPFAPLESDGTRLGLRVHAARPLLDLPGRTGARFRMAYEIDPADRADRDALVGHGWSLVDPEQVSAEPDDYRRFVAGSGVELCVAKEIYSATRSGWFSDRSAVYLASGRPVVASDTGLDDRLTGDGLLTFTDLDGATAAVCRVMEDLPVQSKAARALAEEHLDSDLVLGNALAAVGLT
jgi:hypothetical protein